jgi:hypothetical protein
MENHPLGGNILTHRWLEIKAENAAENELPLMTAFQNLLDTVAAS